MAAPLTPRSILTDAMVQKLNWAANVFERDRVKHACSIRETKRLNDVGGFKEGDNGDKSRVIDHVRKLLFVLAVTCIKDVLLVARFDLARGMAEKEQQMIRLLFFLGVSACLLSPEDDEHLPLSERCYSTENPSLRLFWKDYVLPFLVKCGGSSDVGFDLMTIVCQSVKDANQATSTSVVEPDMPTEEADKLTFLEEFPGKFRLYNGESIKQLAAKVKTEYLGFVETFTKTYLVDGKPRSGKEWDQIVEEFRTSLFRAKQPDTTVPCPDYWLPQGAHSWFVFVYFGPYGRHKWKPAMKSGFLQPVDVEEVDATEHKSRSASRKEKREASRSAAAAAAESRSSTPSSLHPEIVEHLELKRQKLSAEMAIQTIRNKEAQAETLRRKLIDRERRFKSLQATRPSKEQIQEFLVKNLQLEEQLERLEDEIEQHWRNSSNQGVSSASKRRGASTIGDSSPQQSTGDSAGESGDTDQEEFLDNHLS